MALPASADQRPYFKTFGSDILTGGWYASSGTCDTSGSSNYVDPLAAGGNDYSGGIQAFAKSSGSAAAGGSSSQFAAFALGLIEGNSASNYGFYSGGVSAGANYNSLTFADSPNWGGKFQGTVRQSHCIPDYYSKKPASTSGLGAGLSNATASGAYSLSTTGSSIELTDPAAGDITIPAGTQISIYVDGNIYINHNIQYQLTNADQVPKLTIVARGSIYIEPSVSRLDGLYIAQPSSGDPNVGVDDNGSIWTCHPFGTTDVLYTFPTQFCQTTPLVMKNGALIAKQVVLLRIKGDVNAAAASTSEDSLSNAYTSTNISEIINYSPAMVIGGPFFGTASSGSASSNGLLRRDSVVSLPPIF